MEDCQEINELSSGESLFFNGSIAEAIGVAKLEKKSLIIYIAEENEDCQKMDQTTWQDCKVQKAVLEQFVTLRLWHRSTDAAHFAALFPYSTVPCISVINHNGMLLKRLGGYAAPAELLDTLEQLITVQNTAALVAALASANNDSTGVRRESEDNRASNESEFFESEKASSSAMNNDNDTFYTPAAPANITIPRDDNTSQPEHLAFAQMPVQAGGAFSEAQEDVINSQEETIKSQGDMINSQMHMQATGALSEIPEISRTLEVDSGSCDVLSDALSSQNTAVSRALETLQKNPFVTSSESIEQNVVHPQNMEAVSKSKQSAEAFLIQVRLTNGKSIRKSFNAKDCLAAVKEFVDENRDDGNATYSLGMLYPRKVFNEKDMGKSLLELSLDDRASLILVVTSPLQQKSPAAESTSIDAATSDVTNAGTTGFWKFLSYLNPFSYFPGSISNSNNGESGSSSWQFEPDPRLRNSLRQGTESHGLSGQDVDEENTSNRKKAQQGRKWGGNVHTLEHNDTDEAFKRGNAFWNGNSTQYGGDDSKK